MRERASRRPESSVDDEPRVPKAPQAAGILALQRASGNHATSRLLRARNAPSQALEDLEEDEDDELEDEDIDPEAAAYLWTPRPITLADFISPEDMALLDAPAPVQQPPEQRKEPEKKEPEKKAPDKKDEPPEPKDEEAEKRKAERQARAKAARERFQKALLPSRPEIIQLCGLGYAHGAIAELTARWKYITALASPTLSQIEHEADWAENDLPVLLPKARAEGLQVVALQKDLKLLDGHCSTLAASFKRFTVALGALDSLGCPAKLLLTRLAPTMPKLLDLSSTCPMLFMSCESLLQYAMTYEVTVAQSECTDLIASIAGCASDLTAAIRLVESCRIIRCDPKVLKLFSSPLRIFNTCELALGGPAFTGNNRHALSYGLTGWESIRAEGATVVLFRFTSAGVLEIGNMAQHVPNGPGKWTYELEAGQEPQTDFINVLVFRDPSDQFHMDALK